MANLLNHLYQAFNSLTSYFKTPNKQMLLIHQSRSDPAVHISCSTVRRCLSGPENPSNFIIFKALENAAAAYVYDIDTCQTVYLVEKADNKYVVTILFTREYRGQWLNAKLDVILQRILIAEQNIPILQFEHEWAIIGTIDCQPDRNQDNTSFHQDSILIQFLPNINSLKQKFELFFRNTFIEPETFFPNGSDQPGFLVSSNTTAHFGILDYNSPVRIIAAIGKDKGISGNYTFTVLPATTALYRGFLFYLNSIITHATPSPITPSQLTRIRDYLSDIAHKPVGWTDSEFYGGFDSELQLLGAIFNYNKLLLELRRYPRDFRRLLGKYIPINKKTRGLINQLKSDFYTNATNRWIITNPPGPPAWMPAPSNPPSPNYPDPANPADINKYTYVSKQFSDVEVAGLRTNLQATSNNLNNIPPPPPLEPDILDKSVEVQDNKKKKSQRNPPLPPPPLDPPLINMPFQFTIPKHLIDIGEGGKSRSKTSQKRNQRRNTKKRQNKKGKGRRTNKRKQNRRRSKKR